MAYKRLGVILVLGVMLTCFSLHAMEQENTDDTDSIQHSSLIVTLAHYLIRYSLYGLQTTTSAGCKLIKYCRTEANRILMTLNSPITNDELSCGEQ